MSVLRLVQSVDKMIARALHVAVIACIVVVMVLLAMGIFFRAVPVFSMTGYDEIIELLFAWMTFLGAAALWREGALFRVEFLQNLAPPRLRLLLDVIVRLLMLLFAVAFTVQGWIFSVGTIETTAFLMWPKNGWYFSMPASGALMVVYAAAGLFRIARGDREPG